MKMRVRCPIVDDPKEPFYVELSQQIHTFIGGVPGAGKSVVINGLLTTLLYDHPGNVGFILIDPKRVELWDYAKLPHVLQYANGEKPGDMIKALDYAVWLMEWRFSKMKEQHVKMFHGSDVYVIVDELSDLLTTNKREATQLLLRLASLGRASKIHLVLATQQLYSEIVAGPLKANIPSTLGLHTRDTMQSRMLIGVNGCEALPKYGKGIMVIPDSRRYVNVPMINPDLTRDLIEYWSDPDNCIILSNDQTEPAPQEPAPAADARTEAEKRKEQRKALLKRIFGH